MQWPLIDVDDLSSSDVTDLLSEAESYRVGARATTSHAEAVVGLVFFDASLRTLTGFRAATARLGAHSVEVLEPRSSALSVGESWDDTLRVVAGYSDVVVGRNNGPLDQPGTAGRPFINGGSRGSQAAHPTQALVDLFAVRTLLGRDAEHLVIVGDPRMRTARSLTRLLDRCTTSKVSVLADPSVKEVWDDVQSSFSWCSAIPPTADVVYVTGMHHESLPLSDREQLIITPQKLRGVREDAIMLSPMPIIDEIDAAARTDPRARFFEQSDLALFVRMAVLRRALDDSL